jgi:cytochrome c peroxidase
MIMHNNGVGFPGVAAAALVSVTAMCAPIAVAVLSGGPPAAVASQTDTPSSAPGLDEGSQLFRSETFGGNGRTCETCHSPGKGTLSPADVQERLAQDPNDPLFLHDGLDDGVFGTTRIAEHATIRIERPLPPNVRIAEDPSATSVVLVRGIPSTINTPALDIHTTSPLALSLMYDLRNRTLEEQALGAIRGHAQNTIEPTPEQLALIADFQRTDNRFFSSDALEVFARGGPPPTLPEGTTASQKRGRLMFVDTEFQQGSTTGVCALCHSGPMLNRSNQFAPPIVGGPPNARFFDIGVSSRNILNLPVYTFMIDDGRGNVRSVVSPDPGVVLTHPRLPDMPPVTVRHPAFFANMFKTPSLWNVRATAPYFHDNHAKTLEDVAEFYEGFFLEQGMVALTEQDKKDIVAFLKLLR